MKKYLIITITALLLQGCAGYHCTLTSTPTGMIGESNKSVEASKTIDKDGNITMTFSSKKSPSILENLITILSLGLINK